MYALPDAEFTTRSDELAVIVEITQEGAARIRECPPGVVVMIVEDGRRPKEVSPADPEQRKRSICAGKREGSSSSIDSRHREDIEVREIPVEFPG